MDARLVIRAQDGDEIAFARLADGIYGRLQQLAYRALRDPTCDSCATHAASRPGAIACAPGAPADAANPGGRCGTQPEGRDTIGGHAMSIGDDLEHRLVSWMQEDAFLPEDVAEVLARLPQTPQQRHRWSMETMDLRGRT
jgi:hypothetical protein